MMKFRSTFTLLLALPLLISGVASAQIPRVAVFEQPEFPFYNASPLISPRGIAANLRRAGIAADTLDADDLANPKRLNARAYAALVMPYGNTFPQSAFANLQAFHRASGSLILSGVPFTHPVTRLSAQGWLSNPGWGNSVRTVPQSHSGRLALELSGPKSDWVGVNSERLPIRAGQKISVSAWTQTLQGAEQAGKGGDWLYVRFFNGGFISQAGARITPGAQWHQITATVSAPANVTHFDIAPQVRSSGRVLRLDDIAASVDGRAIALDNAGFEAAGREWNDLGHSDAAPLFGPGGIGVGTFEDGPTGAVTIAAGDPLGLGSLGHSWPQDPELQAIDVSKLPPGVTIKPALLEAGRPVTALLVHRSGPFRGAVDAWVNLPNTPDLDAFFTEQVLARAAIAALIEKKQLSASRRAQAFAILGKLPRPKVYANITLPPKRRAYTTFQPKMPVPARRLYVADIRDLRPEQQLVLATLQGIVNRVQPRIYLTSREDDTFWLEDLKQQGHIDEAITVANPMSLVQTFRSSIKGAVVPDPKIYVSPNVAVSIAGLDDLVVSTPELAAQLKLPIRTDLRGHFRDNAEALRFLRTDLLPRSNPFLSICLDPSMLGNGSIDQIVAARGLAFWITGTKQASLPGANMAREIEEIKQLFAAMPLGSVVRGFWWHGDNVGLSEAEGVSLGSRFGKITLVSDYVRNFSVLSGVPQAALRQKLAPAPRLDRSKVYIAFTMSDGDNMSVWPSYFRDYFRDPLHGTIPIGWGMTPALLDCAPSMAQWFYNRATSNDEFICDVSGVGYIYPPDWGTALRDRQSAFSAFYGETQRAMERMDMKTIRLMNVGTPDIPMVGSLLPRVDFLMPDYGWSGPRTYEELTYTLPTGQPVFRAALEGQGQGPAEKAARLRARAGAARPAFLNAFIWNWGSKLSDLKEMLEILGPEYVAVTPSQLNTLYREAQAQAGQTQTREAKR